MKQITIPMSEDEYNLITSVAKQTGRSRASFCRYHILSLIKEEETATNETD